MGSIQPAAVNLIDIRGENTTFSLLNILQNSLRAQDGSQPSMPTLLLYDEKGLKLFEKITYLDEYYLTNAEIEVLNSHADAIATRIPDGARLIELGSGNLRKVNILLQALERAQKSAHYYALDVSESELQRTFAKIDVDQYKYVTFNALLGTYDDGLAWLANPAGQSRATVVMSLGSSIGNFSRPEAAEFLAGFADVLGAGDLLLIGLDACQNAERVWHAYNDSKAITEQFYRNGLDHANFLLGKEVFKQDEWLIEGVYDEELHCHQASYIALADVQVLEVSFQKGDRIFLENAYKYSVEQRDQLWHKAGLISQCDFGNGRDDYHIHLLSPSPIKYSDNPALYASHPVPNLTEWEQMWTLWDIATKAMIPRDELMSKPIKLRNNLIFYLGHIPAFADIHYTKAANVEPTTPAYYHQIFERGIDPDVDDPTKCHAHSEIPAEWPPLTEMLDYSHRVRMRIRNSIESGLATSDRKLARSLNLAYEHEALHLETFLYMLLQSDRILPPPGRDTPDFEVLAHNATLKRDTNKWHDIPAALVRIGLDDQEDNFPPDRYFVWDNERPARMVNVASFKAQSRPISNGEFAFFLESTCRDKLPASWTTLNIGDVVIENGYHHSVEAKVTEGQIASPKFLCGKAVRTVYGPVPLKYALDWPAMASYDELEAYAKWAEGRIPSLEEARSIYSYVESQKLGPEKISSTLISAVNGHLCNDGVEETPPSKPLSHNAVNGAAAGPNPHDAFVDLTGCNVSFKTWHPTPVTSDGDRLRGQSDAGGLWEWTSSPLTAHEGFKAMDLYPGYSADFFDDKHNVILGGSWATIPRIAGRKSFVNWYQRNYPFTWATARLVRDLH